MDIASRIEPFTIDVPEATLADLRERLGRTRWPDAVAGAGWDYGADVGYLRELCAYWADGFDWRAQETALNELPHHRAAVGGLNLHFIHRRAAREDATALLLLHGWPSSFLQMVKIMPLLDDFHLVVPSLPGFGFSDRPTEPGMSVGAVADLFVELMRDRLGYEHYAIRASDLGAGIAPQMAMKDADAVTALHMSGSNPSADYSRVPDDLTDAERRMVEDARAFIAEEFAYAKLHATKPQTPAFGSTTRRPAWPPGSSRSSAAGATAAATWSAASAATSCSRT
jgi:pimeloyl-ACP methyl ester carboxylesterase